MKFCKDAIREIKHVVWPTRQETKRYFAIVLSVLIAFGIYLFLAGSLFSEIVFGLKNVFNPTSLEETQIDTNALDIQKDINIISSEVEITPSANETAT